MVNFCNGIGSLTDVWKDPGACGLKFLQAIPKIFQAYPHNLLAEDAVSGLKVMPASKTLISDFGVPRDGV